MASIKDRRLILDFLRRLRSHNDREWLEAHRPEYEAARAAYEALVAELLASFGPVDDLGGVGPKECIFRLNRDLRFSRDKAPYKTAMGAVLGRAGRKSGVRSYYLHVEAGASFLAGGLYEPSPAELGAVRSAIAADARPLRKLLGAPDFLRYFGGLSGESLKTAPQGYPKDHPEIELLRRKQFLVAHPLEDSMVASEELVHHALSVYAAMKPFLLYLESLL
jgi:uncharacterized protein (TIGR02453 family)